MPKPLSAAGALAVFLSSTIGDYEDYRREVQDVRLRKAKCACFLREDWIGGYDATVQKCRDRVRQSGGFILLLGYWYGSIPPGKDKSMTHLEFGVMQLSPRSHLARRSGKPQTWSRCRSGRGAWGRNPGYAASRAQPPSLFHVEK